MGADVGSLLGMGAYMTSRPDRLAVGQKKKDNVTQRIILEEHIAC